MDYLVRYYFVSMCGIHIKLNNFPFPTTLLDGCFIPFLGHLTIHLLDPDKHDKQSIFSTLLVLLLYLSSVNWTYLVFSSFMLQKLCALTTSKAWCFFLGGSELDQLDKICSVLGAPDWNAFPEARKFSELVRISHSQVCLGFGWFLEFPNVSWSLNFVSLFPW